MAGEGFPEGAAEDSELAGGKGGELGTAAGVGDLGAGRSGEIGTAAGVGELGAGGGIELGTAPGGGAALVLDTEKVTSVVGAADWEGNTLGAPRGEDRMLGSSIGWSEENPETCRQFPQKKR